MKKKNVYHSPSIQVVEVRPFSILQASTKAEIPDAGWGGKGHVRGIIPEELSDEFENKYLWEK